MAELREPFGNLYSWAYGAESALHTPELHNEWALAQLLGHVVGRATMNSTDPRRCCRCAMPSGACSIYESLRANSINSFVFSAEWPQLLQTHHGWLCIPSAVVSSVLEPWFDSFFAFLSSFTLNVECFCKYFSYKLHNKYLSMIQLFVDCNEWCWATCMPCIVWNNAGSPNSILHVFIGPNIGRIPGSNVISSEASIQKYLITHSNYPYLIHIQFRCCNQSFSFASINFYLTSINIYIIINFAVM